MKTSTVLSERLGCRWDVADEMAPYRGKRVFDLAVAVPVLLISLPVQALVGAAIALKLGCPVLFRQTRPGLYGKPFEMIKFRTMIPVDMAKEQIDDASRMTPMGRILRSTSLDELPSLWNIIRGDMSIVGPRPLLMQYLGRYTPLQARRHDVKPGLTGLAQISGRNALSWEEKFRLDVVYVETSTFRFDMKILAASVILVLSQKGVSSERHATAPEFFTDDLTAVRELAKRQ